jgi:nitronate monooxygenase
MDRLGSLLGIEVPIVQSGMGGVAGPELAAAVCEAGGLGILAALMLPPDVLRKQIADLRSRTERPFGINIWMHDELLPPLLPAELDVSLLGGVRRALDEIRQARGLAPVGGEPQPTPNLIPDALEVMIDERVPVFSAGVGLPPAELVERFHRVGTTVMAMVTNTVDATEAVARGVDIVVAQGSEAGGHRSVGTKLARDDALGLGTMVLVPAVRDVVGDEVAVVAAGGIADGRGVAAALVLGADGVLLGTRFVATAESAAHPAWKERLLDGERRTVVTDSFTGQWARTLRNDYVARYERTGVGTLPSLLQMSVAGDIFATAREAGEAELMPLYAGDSARLLRDLPAAGEVVERLVAEAEQALGRPLRLNAAS